QAGVARLAAKALDARNGRHGRRRERPDGHDQKLRARPSAVGALDLPFAGDLVVRRGRGTTTELDVTPQVELVRDELAVPQRLRLGREVLAPLPFAQDLVREGVPVCPRFGVEPRAGITVPVPRAADAVASLEHAHAEPQPAQPMELIHAGDAGPDHDGVVARCHAWAPITENESKPCGCPPQGPDRNGAADRIRTGDRRSAWDIPYNGCRRSVDVA